MHLFDFAPELIELIFENLAYSRKFNRFMRLRLVNCQFRHFVDNAIFRLRLIDIHLMDFPWKPLTCRFDNWRAFIIEYWAYQAWIEKEPYSALGRIRHAAVTISKEIGDMEQASIHSRLKSLCFLTLSNGDEACFTNPEFLCPESLRRLKCSDEELKADVCVAAVYLGCRPYIEKLISQGYQFSTGKVTKDVSGDVFGTAFEAATFKGDVSMLRLLMSSNPNCNLNSAIQKHTLHWAAVLGYKDAFDFALDIKPIDPTAEEREDGRWPRKYDWVKEAIISTRHPENYERAISIFPKSHLIHSDNRMDLLCQLHRKANSGHADMMQYLLSQAPWSNQEDLINELENDYHMHELLLVAIRSGNVDVVKVLLDHRADPNNFPSHNTPLMYAARLSRVTMTRMLLEAGAKVDEGYPPPIVFAVSNENMAMFRLLREYGARLDTPETGNWAMAVAQLYKLESMIDVLVREGVERGAILRRCAESTESYQRQYYLLHRAAERESIWLDAVDEWYD
ncbi:ankyrin repeat-containing domain protein [Annulohypoxylon maeteangense]|uniref:ankyrin repeat-containing domain protein n=1 Tax=Annulohypoxylon maeteangense TaxID=1927788 RepID=UPI00200804EF|nr:ankyrin repeat-containing domain protein [Annulohypoxylon maeteangense]KAI0886578.1 ankyrin repeat-containing domain protein [Annulohypoxylon maeteangense]